MATHAGKDGLVKVGSNTVTEVRNWSLDLSSDTIEDSTMGDTARTYKAGMTTASASFDCYWDETDTNGQGALTIGASVALTFYPEGDDSGDTYYSGTALVTSLDKSADGEGLVTNTIGVTGTGALGTATV